jgi:hypothetical protein
LRINDDANDDVDDYVSASNDANNDVGDYVGATMMQTTGDGGVRDSWFLKHIRKDFGCCSLIALNNYLEH